MQVILFNIIELFQYRTVYYFTLNWTLNDPEDPNCHAIKACSNANDFPPKLLNIITFFKTVI